ncbi:hypothetical protein F5Y16DRAFT_418277 [Xylariaceae sp. FL0255]|nr:hypothetical protein F5Y16DRAFT_418277 [Xylariaceae sp. FL0255]
MKYISRDKDRLVEAMSRIKELEDQNAMLQMEIKKLRIRQNPYSSSPMSPRAFKSRDGKPPISRYARATFSSTKKTQMAVSATPRMPIASGIETVTRGERTPSHMYDNGALVTNLSHECLFKQSTRASAKREDEIDTEILRRRILKNSILRRRVDYRPPSLPDSAIDCESGPFGSTWESWSEASDDLVWDGPVDVDISSVIGFEYLWRAHTLAQEMIYPLIREHGSIDGGGPHLLGLVRDELHSVIGDRIGPMPWLAMNGYDKYQVHDAILRVVHVRNRVCHPDTYHWSYVDKIDDGLKSVQGVAVMFRKYEQIDELRAMRDNLVVHARESHAIAEKIRHFATLP